MDDGLRILFPPEEIRLMVARLAGEIRADYAARDPVVIGVLKGAFVFVSDLIRALEMPLDVDFIRASRYSRPMDPAPEAVITSDIGVSIEGRDVIIADGIVDRGRTLGAVVRHLRGRGPKTIKTCALLARDGGLHEVRPDYVGRRIERGFVVGYGMDFEERYRGLSGIYVMDGRK
jgi:hypoxanthine phosphoribosyltransferase